MMGITIEIFGIPTFFSVFTLVLALLFGFASYKYIQREVNEHLPWNGGKGLMAGAFIATVSIIFTVVIHEVSHALAAIAFDIPIDGAGMSGWGAWVEMGMSFREMPSFAALVVTLAGPMSNLIIGLLLVIPVYRYGESVGENTIQYIGEVNLSLFRWNMFPFLIVVDGGKFTQALVRMTGLTQGFWFWALFVVFGIIVSLLTTYGPVKRLEENFKKL